MTGAGQGEEFKESTHNGKPAPRIERDEQGTEGRVEKLSEIKRVCVVYIRSVLRLCFETLNPLHMKHNGETHLDHKSTYSHCSYYETLPLGLSNLIYLSGFHNRLNPSLVGILFFIETLIL